MVLHALCVTLIAEQANLNIAFGFPGLLVARITKGQCVNLFLGLKRHNCGVEVLQLVADSVSILRFSPFRIFIRYV